MGLFLFSILFSQESYLGLITLFGFLCLWEFSKIIQLKILAPYIFFAATLFLISTTVACIASIVLQQTARTSPTDSRTFAL